MGPLVLAVLAATGMNAAVFCDGGVTSGFVRNAEKSVDMPLDSDVFEAPLGYNAPQQVHITQGDHAGKAVIVSWVTVDEPGSNIVVYWAENSSWKHKAKGSLTEYKYYNYTSGYIHHCSVRNLEYDTKYYYEVGVGGTTRTFWFPYTFGLIDHLLAIR